MPSLFRNIISGNTLAIEFFNNEKRGFGGEIDAEELQDLSYEKPEHFTGYYGLTKLFDVADSFKIRGWDSNYNFSYTKKPLLPMLAREVFWCLSCLLISDILSL